MLGAEGLDQLDEAIGQRERLGPDRLNRHT